MSPGSKSVDADHNVTAPRDLTLTEQSRLEVSIARVSRLFSPLSAAVVSAAWDQSIAAGNGDPEVARTVGVAVGTLLLDADPTARWVSCPGPRGWTPGVVSNTQPYSPVLVIADALSRWPSHPGGWVQPYIDGAVAHLTSPAGLGDDHPWIATPDDLPQPPGIEVRDLAATALDLGLALAGDEWRAFAVLPGTSGPVSAPAPGDPSDHDAVRAWARGWAEQSMTPLVAVAWVEPPRGAARHAAGRAGSVTVEANEAGRPGMVVAHEFVTSMGTVQPSGLPIILGSCDPII